MLINGNVNVPAVALPVRRKAETVKEVLATDERDVPQVRNAAVVFFDWNFKLQPLQQCGADGIEFEMLTQFVQGGKDDGRADEEYGLVLECGHYDLMRRADAVDVRGAIRNAEVAGVHHAEINVQRFPELSRAPGAGLRTRFAAFISPALADALAALHVFAAILVQAAYVRLEPRIEHRHTHLLQKLANAIAPAELFLRRARRDKVHRAGEVNASALEQAALGFRFRFGHARMLSGNGYWLKRGAAHYP